MIKSDINGYYLYNAHGDVIQLTDQQGAITRSYLYDAFGVEQEALPDDPNPFRYCGEYLDKESGNVYLRARYYDPEIGRFISEDPIQAGLNWYAYCNNNPIRFIDPWGLAPGDVTMPNGDVIHGTITNGITHLPDGSRPPNGAVVETAAGFYMMSNGSGVKVTPTSVTTSDGRKVTGYNAGGTTYMLGGSRPTMGSTVHTSDGDYLMTASGGVKVGSAFGPQLSSASGGTNYNDDKIDTYLLSGTTGWGINGQLSGGYTLGLSVQYVYDNAGNKGILISVIPLTGGGTPNASISGVRSTTNANSIYHLRGWTTNGGTAGCVGVIPIGGGFEYIEGAGYSGQAILIGARISPPIEVHANRSYAWVLGW